MDCFGISSFSVPFCHPHPLGCLLSVLRNRCCFTVKTLWHSSFSISVQMLFLYYVAGRVSTIFIWHSLCGHVETQLVFHIWKLHLALILIYWLVNSSTLTLQSFNLPKDCYYWSCSAWHWFLLILATLLDLFLIRQSGVQQLIKLDGGRTEVR